MGKASVSGRHQNQARYHARLALQLALKARGKRFIPRITTA